MLKKYYYYCFFIAILCITGCNKKNSINIVKDGVLDFNKTLTVGQAFDNWKSCKSNSWESFKTENGIDIVEFKCELKIDEFSQKLRNFDKDYKKGNEEGTYLDFKSALLTFQFSINKDNTFQIHGINSKYIWVDNEEFASQVKNTQNQLKFVYSNGIMLDVSNFTELDYIGSVNMFKAIKPGEKYTNMKPNFAGHYVIKAGYCGGGGCLDYTITDKDTKRKLAFPTDDKEKITSLYYSIDSNIISEISEFERKKDKIVCAIKVYALEGTEFKKTQDTKQEISVDGDCLDMKIKNGVLTTREHE